MQHSENGQLGVALIGAGVIGRTHVDALSALPEATRLEVLMSRRLETAAALADHYDGPAPRVCDDLAAVTSDPRVQAAIVTTPPNVRIDLIQVLAAAGKNVLLEKPVARTLDEARRVVEICEATGVTFGMVFQHRVRNTAREAAALVAEGSLGGLGHVEIAVPLWREQSYYDDAGRGTYDRDGGGVLLTNAIHSIDLALSLTGPVTEVQAMTATTVLHDMQAEDFAMAGLRFASGAVGSLMASTASFPHRTEVIRLHFERASLRLDREALVIDWRDGRSERRGEEQPAKHVWHARVIEDFAQALDKGGKPIVTGRDALAAHAVIEAIERSSREGKRVAVAKDAR